MIKSEGLVGGPQPRTKRNHFSIRLRYFSPGGTQPKEFIESLKIPSKNFTYDTSRTPRRRP